MNMFLTSIRNRKWLENCKNQIMIGKQRHMPFALRVKEPLMNLQKHLKEGFTLVFLSYAYLLFKDDLD